MAERTTVEVGGRTLAVSNLDKVLYPATGTTKAEVVRYALEVSTVMLPHLAERPVTMRRYPDGVDGEGFFEKRCPSHRPEWLATITVGRRAGDGRWARDGRPPPRPGDTIEHCDLADVAALVWAANLAALELHVPMGRRPDPDRPTMVVFDLDPGAPADVLTCARVALLLREVFDRLGLVAVPKTSGAKGIQVYVPVNTEDATYEATRTFAVAVARLLERDDPALVVTTQDKQQRSGRVLIDWSQNHPIKTTVCAYSLRAQPRPTVSTPMTWDEVSDGLDGAESDAFTFEIDDALGRVRTHGDLFAAAAEVRQELPSLG